MTGKEKGKTEPKGTTAGIVGIDIEAFVKNAVAAKKSRGKTGLPKVGTLMRRVFDIVNDAAEECRRDKLFGLRMGRIRKTIEKTDKEKKFVPTPQKIRNYTKTLSLRGLMKRVKIKGVVYVMPRDVVSDWAKDKKAWQWLLANDEYSEQFGK